MLISSSWGSSQQVCDRGKTWHDVRKLKKRWKNIGRKILTTD